MKSEHKFGLEPGLFFVIPLVLLLFPLRFLCAWIIAATVHELGHMIAAYLSGARIDSVNLGPFGAKISISPLRNHQNLLCSAGGPLLGGLLVLFGRNYPMLALCAFVQTAYNLLPLPNNDGEKILESLLFRLASTCRQRIIVSIRICCVAAVIFFTIRFLSLGPLIPLVGSMILFKSVKIPCKRGKQIVQ